MDEKGGAVDVEFDWMDDGSGWSECGSEGCGTIRHGVGICVAVNRRGWKDDCGTLTRRAGGSLRNGNGMDTIGCGFHSGNMVIC